MKCPHCNYVYGWNADTLKLVEGGEGDFYRLFDGGDGREAGVFAREGGASRSCLACPKCSKVFMGGVE